MKMQGTPPPSTETLTVPNGPGAAAILAAGAGSFAVGLFAVAADLSPSFKNMMVLYRPTGPLSGVTTAAILVWLLTWGLLEWRWKHRTVNLARTNALAFALLALGLLLTFPPFVDIL